MFFFQNTAIGYDLAYILRVNVELKETEQMHAVFGHRFKTGKHFQARRASLFDQIFG